VVVASTSPFWTMLLSLYFEVAGRYTPALLSLTAVVVWLSAAFVLFRAARDIWRLPGWAVAVCVLIWLAHATLVANALGGLENVLAALQLLLIYWLTSGGWTAASDQKVLTTGHWPLAAVLGLLLGWAILTRPDGGLLALLLVGMYGLRLAAVRVRAGDGERSAHTGQSAAGQQPATGHWLLTTGHWALIALVAFAVLVPWYAFQWAETGRLVTDSSVARLYNGRQGSLALIPGLLYLHPKALVSLGTAFLPLSLGFLGTAALLLRDFARASGRRVAFLVDGYPRLAAVVVVVAGVVFFTVVVGAEAFGRYFLPVFPFLILAGVGGWVAIAGQWPAALRRPWVVLIALGVLFLTATSALDAYRRLGPGRFAPERALDVITGPAARQYTAFNMPFLVAAPPAREALTDGFLADLGAPDAQDISIAVTEVQLRYVLDERVDVLSLDGRTSADILTYTDPRTGVPDFERYFEATRPDYVHAAQWCEVGGWLAGVLPLPIEDNLVCAWERRAAGMAPGDRFTWQGRDVTLVAPAILRIDWE
jgi:hypothetical protein